jgi:predicted O-methyltransferase YrrM
LPHPAPNSCRTPQRPPSDIGEILQYKEPESALRDYLRQSANAPIPGLDAIRERSAAAYGAAASKATALEVCLLLRWLAASRGCLRALEIGVFTGSSSLALLDGLGPQGSLCAIDIDPAATAIAQQAWQEQGLQTRVQVLMGDALAILPTLEPGFELIYVDGANWEYEAYLDAALPLLAPQGVMVFDNVLWRRLVLNPDPSDASASGLARFNASLSQRPELLSCVLNLGDGVALVSRRDNG